jgi:hypothetical protein
MDRISGLLRVVWGVRGRGVFGAFVVAEISKEVDVCWFDMVWWVGGRVAVGEVVVLWVVVQLGVVRWVQWCALFVVDVVVVLVVVWWWRGGGVCGVVMCRQEGRSRRDPLAACQARYCLLYRIAP